jgi:hypothetical protein
MTQDVEPNYANLGGVPSPVGLIAAGFRAITGDFSRQSASLPDI